MLDGDLDNQVPLEETRKVATLFPDSTFVTITGPGHLTVAGAGVVLKVDKSGNETVLYAFTGGADGGVPYAGLVRDSVGKLYGTTAFGGQTNAGVVFAINP